jgi:pimeloyl-ACP methyl ester carboxylesterase
MNRRTKIRPASSTFVALLLALAGWPSASAALPGLTEKRVAEPIFRGQIQIYSAGPMQAPPVVLVHGIGEKAARDWDGLIPRLARDFRVLTFDLPGFGRSSKDNDPYTPANYAALVRYVIERELGSRPVRLVGHSLGGAIALRYAALYPQEVEALVLADVPGILHRMAYSKYLTHLGINFLPNLYPEQNDHLRNLAGNLLGWLEKIQPAPEAIVVNPKFRKNFLSADPAKIAGLALALEDFSADLPRVRVPTLLLWGGRDELAPLRNGRALAAMLPDARLEVFPASGHTPMDDVPESFNARVTDFLAAPVLAPRAPENAAPPTAPRRASCQGQREVQFEGDYDSLVIERCREVLVRNARVRQLRIADSAVTIEDSLIGGANGGLIVDENSRVIVTAGRITGRVAVTASGARLDLAGVHIEGETAAIEAPRASQLLFSISELHSPHFSGRLHGLRVLQPGGPL